MKADKLTPAKISGYNLIYFDPNTNVKVFENKDVYYLLTTEKKVVRYLDIDAVLAKAIQLSKAIE
jgi:hypothetical protein